MSIIVCPTLEFRNGCEPHLQIAEMMILPVNRY